MELGETDLRVNKNLRERQIDLSCNVGSYMVKQSDRKVKTWRTEDRFRALVAS